MTQYLSDHERMWYGREDREAEDPLAHEKLHAVMQCLKDNQDGRRRDALLFGSMYYGSLPTVWISRYGYGEGGGAATPSAHGSISLNVSRNVVDAVVSRIAAKSRPHLSYVTDGADYEKQHNAEALERGVSGVFYESGFHDKSLDAFRDACIFAAGHTRIWADQETRKVRVDRVLPTDLTVDEGEMFYADGPRSLYLDRYEDRGVLAHVYRDDPEKVKLIERIALDRTEDAEKSYRSAALRVHIEEAWHRPSGKGAGDGRHVVAIRNCTLVDEPWEGDDWDVATFVWNKGLVPPYGQGIVEMGAEIQAEINRIVRDIRAAMHLIKGHYLVEQNSKVVTAHINNDLTTILKYQGIAPTYQAPAIIAPEVYQHLWNLMQKYYEIAGVNQQAAQAQKPAGLDSGEAQRVYADQQTETLLERGERYNEYVRKCGELVTMAAKELARHGAYEVRAMNDDGFETINWKELDSPDGYEATISATSSLPGTPSGRIDLAYDMQKLGTYDAEDILEIVGMPDTNQKSKMKLASRRLVEKKVGEMLRGEIPSWEPHSLLNLDEAIVIARDAHNLAESKGVDDARLLPVRDFVAACIQAQGQAPAPAPQAVGPGGANLLGPGQAAPVPLGGQQGSPAPSPAPSPQPQQGKAA